MGSLLLSASAHQHSPHTPIMQQQLEPAQQAHIQCLLQALQTHLSTVATAPPPVALPSPALAIPAQWQTAGMLIRQLRAAASSMYEAVLTEDEKDKAAGWGFKPTDGNDGRIPLVPRLSAEEDTVEAAVRPASAAVLQATQFHRFALPLNSLVEQCSAATKGVRRIVSYHTALIACLQTQQKLPPTQPQNQLQLRRSASRRVENAQSEATAASMCMVCRLTPHEKRSFCRDSTRVFVPAADLYHLHLSERIEAVERISECVIHTLDHSSQRRLADLHHIARDAEVSLRSIEARFVVCTHRRHHSRTPSDEVSSGFERRHRFAT